jgi:hypothetical protein
VWVTGKLNFIPGSQHCGRHNTTTVARRIENGEWR